MKWIIAVVKFCLHYLVSCFTYFGETVGYLFVLFFYLQLEPSIPESASALALGLKIGIILGIVLNVISFIVAVGQFIWQIRHDLDKSKESRHIDRV